MSAVPISVPAAPPLMRLDVLVAVCDVLGVEEGDLYRTGRQPRVVLARQVYVHLCKGPEVQASSYPEIARDLCRANHSTVVTAHQRHRRAKLAGRRVEAAWPFDFATLEELEAAVLREARRVQYERFRVEGVVPAPSPVDTLSVPRINGRPMTEAEMRGLLAEATGVLARIGGAA